MFRSTIFPTTVATVIFLSAAGVAFADRGEKESAKEIAAVLSAKTPIVEAISAAEQKTGGRAMKAEIEREKGVYVYEIKTVSKDKAVKVFVDPTSGKVVRTDDAGLIAKIFDRDDQDEVAELAAWPTTLTAAITTAEQHVGGKSIEARFDDEDGKPLFKIEVAKDSTVHKVTIDATNGKVLKVATTHEDEHHRD